MHPSSRPDARPQRGRTISQVLDAVLASPVDLELILVDDGSTDRTWELMEARAAADPRVHAYRHQVNQGRGRRSALRSGNARERWC